MHFGAPRTFCYNRCNYKKECGYYAKLVFNYPEKSVVERLYLDNIFSDVVLLHCAGLLGALYINWRVDYDLLFYFPLIRRQT